MSGAIRKTWDLAALFVVLNVISLLGVAAYLVGTGALTAETGRRVLAALRGESAAKLMQAAPPPVVLPKGLFARTDQVDNADAEAQMDIEILQREAERVKVELDQRLVLSNSILLKVKTEREEFKAEREAAVRRDEQTRNLVRDEGFEKQIAIFEALSPKVAVQHLISMNNPEEAAKVLTALDADRARKIVEAAKRGSEMSQMQAILQRIREVGAKSPPKDREFLGAVEPGGAATP
ncbi:MAG: hypothetical protein AABZ12_02075 [Planctomycetota bacterium]